MKQFVNYNSINTEESYHSTDCEKLFNKNRKKLGKDWIYYDKKITYRYNEQGFRNDSFDKINWSESIVIFGCSNIQGIGLAEEDTLARQLEKILNRKVVNLGIAASSVDMACWNSIILHDFYPHPKAIVQVWTSLDRYAAFKNNRCYSYTSVNPEYYYKIDWAQRSKLYIQTDRALWKNKTVYIEASFFEDTVKQMKIQELKTIDYARDLMHPGIKSNRIAAEIIAENLIKQNI